MIEVTSIQSKVIDKEFPLFEKELEESLLNSFLYIAECLASTFNLQQYLDENASELNCTYGNIEMNVTQFNVIERNN